MSIQHLLTNTSQSAGTELFEKPLDRPLRVKLGMDPTAPDLHLGHAVVLKKLRAFQDAGHEAILIVGAFTAQIGDPTGKNKTRPPLSAEDVEKNAKTYLEQAFKILDPHKTKVVRNDTWLGKLTAIDIINLTAKVTVAQILARDDFANRMSANETISMHELLYPLMQGMDSVHLKADVELGGTDQWFNLHMGRALQEKFGQAPQAVVTMPLLVGLHGVHKMSKSLNNHIPLAGDPNDAYGRFMSVSDDTMWLMLPVLELASPEEIAIWKNECNNGLHNPMHVKMEIAHRLVEWLHGPDAATTAQLHFTQKHSQGLDVALPEHKVSADCPITVSALMKALGLASSISDASRKMEQGGVRINGVKVVDKTHKLNEGAYRIEVGKRHGVVLTLVSKSPSSEMVCPT